MTKHFNTTREFVENLLAQALVGTIPTSEKYVIIYNGQAYDNTVTLEEIIENTVELVDNNRDKVLDIYEKNEAVEKKNEGILLDSSDYDYEAEEDIQESVNDIIYDIFGHLYIGSVSEYGELFYEYLVPFYQSQNL
jgi:hypothetical protein